jgi:hypothetical protein
MGVLRALFVGAALVVPGTDAMLATAGSTNLQHWHW